MTKPEDSNVNDLRKKHLGHTEDYQVAFSELLHQKLNRIAKQGNELTNEKYLVDLMALEVQWERAQLIEIAKSIREDMEELKGFIRKLKFQYPVDDENLVGGEIEQ